MTAPVLDRRRALAATAAAALAALLPAPPRAVATASATAPATPSAGAAAATPAAKGLQIRVMHDHAGRCCSVWTDVLRVAGFAVEEERLAQVVLDRRRAEYGLPKHVRACHTAVIDGYVIEGHVPVADILSLLEVRPTDALGLYAPGAGETGAPVPAAQAAGLGADWQVKRIGRDGALAPWPRGGAA